MPILWVFKSDVFFCSDRLVCYIKRRKSIFHDLFLRYITRGYTGLQWVAESYRGLQGVTGGYKGLLEVTGGYKRLQGVTPRLVF